jgi:transposase
MHDIETLAVRLERIEESLRLLLKERVEQRFYSTADAAKILGKAEFTVREWCRNRRVRAQKRPCGHGNSKEWMIAHDELERIQSEGLLERKQAISTSTAK